jgi:polyphosphate glucokinase
MLGGTGNNTRRKEMKREASVLVIDIGGNNVKLLASGQTQVRKFPSGPQLTPKKMVAAIKRTVTDWEYEVVSIGYPGVVLRGKIQREPKNLAKGWIGFDFGKAFGCPVQLINDAAMQAIGSYEGGRMLFLGLGTGLGSSMIVDGVLEPMELAHLPYRNGKTFEDYVGARGLEKLGKKKWQQHVFRVIKALSDALEPEYVVLGGGNVKKMKELPPNARPGNNANAFKGGFRIWQISTEGRHEHTTELVIH